MSPSWLDKLYENRFSSGTLLISESLKGGLLSCANLKLSCPHPRQHRHWIHADQTKDRGAPGHHSQVSAAPRIFALVVAIDVYKNPAWDFLTGCRNDGTRFIQFLTGVLGVPSLQIMFLADEEATKAEIVKQFKSFLTNNPEIQRDDAIIFYFAGHGSRLDAPPGWVTENDTIETLCTHDWLTPGDDEKEVLGITDRAIDAMMRELAYEKGDNIVAVFDCCHSGGLSRGEEPGLRARCLPSPPGPTPADLDSEIWSSVPEPGARAAKTVIQTGFQYKAMASHVLLAACRPDEQALEDREGPGGLFTTALIESLRRSSLHDTSYAKLFERMDLKHKHQHPQCEGVNKDRLLFSVNTFCDEETAFKISEKGKQLYVSAGSIHGVVVGTEFTVEYPTQKFVLKAKEVQAFRTTLDGSLPSIADAKVTVSNWHHPTLKVHSPIQSSSIHVTVVPANEPAEVSLCQDGPGEWVLERLDPLIPIYSDRFVRFDANAGRMRDILDVVANFNSYLYRSDGPAASFAGKVKIQLNRIGLNQGEYGPIRDDLLNVPRSSHSGVDVKEAIITDLDSKYCFTLQNFTEVDFFPYFFYFDPSDYSVQSWYTPPAPTMNAPLRRVKEDGTPTVFALGYGGFGTDPIEFYLPPESNSDSGFLKVFLTTAYVDMANVAQSPISEAYGSRGLKYTLKGTWTCETFVLTCRRS